MTDRQAISGAKVLTNVNTAVTNIVMVAPLSASTRTTKALTIVKPTEGHRGYTFTAQFEADLKSETAFQAMVKTPGFSPETLESAISSFLQPTEEDDDAGDDQLSPRQIQEQWEFIDTQKLPQAGTVHLLSFAKVS